MQTQDSKDNFKKQEVLTKSITKTTYYGKAKVSN